jgi:hypothetical protein
LTEPLDAKGVLATEVWDFDAGEYTTMGVAAESRHRWTTVGQHGIPTGGIPYDMPEAHKEVIWRRFRDDTHDGPIDDYTRAEICFTFANCPHTTGTLVELESGWSVILCERCGEPQSRKQCRHGRSEWQLDGLLLVCPNCGIDGT